MATGSGRMSRRTGTRRATAAGVKAGRFASGEKGAALRKVVLGGRKARLPACACATSGRERLMIGEGMRRRNRERRLSVVENAMCGGPRSHL